MKRGGVHSGLARGGAAGHADDEGCLTLEPSHTRTPIPGPAPRDHGHVWQRAHVVLPFVSSCCTALDQCKARSSRRSTAITTPAKRREFTSKCAVEVPTCQLDCLKLCGGVLNFKRPTPLLTLKMVVFCFVFFGSFIFFNNFSII